MGEDITDLAEGTSKLRNEIKALSGVDIMTSENQYKDMYDIMVELSKVWDNLTQTQQNTILEDIAGKRNSSAIASIITNLKDLEGAYGAASSASGTLAEANAKYSDSIQGKINQVKTTFTQLSNNLLDSGIVNGVVDLGNGVLKLANLLGEIKALLPAIVAGFMSWNKISIWNTKGMQAQGYTSIFDAIKSIGKVDLDVINRYNAALAQSKTAQEAYNIATTNAVGGKIKLNRATKDAILSANGEKVALDGLTASSVGATIATMALNAVITMGIGLLISWLPKIAKAIYNVTSPIGRLKKAIEYTNKSLEEYSNASQELETVNDRLEEIRLKISEINDGTPLSLTEKAELETLRAETRELERQKQILESDAESGRNNVVSGADDVINNFDATKNKIPYMPSTDHWSNFVGNLLSPINPLRPTGATFNDIPLIGPWLDHVLGRTQTGEEIQEDIDSAVKTVQGALKTLWDSGYRYQNGSGEYDEQIEKYEQFLYEDLVRDGADISQLSQYLMSMSKYQDEIAQIKEQLASGTFDVTALENLFNSNEDFKELLISLIESGALGEDLKEEIAGDDGVVSAEEAATIATKDFKDILPLLANEFNKVEDAADNAESSISSVAKTLSESLDKLNDKKDILSKVKEQLDGFGAISADNISKILEQFSDNEDVQQAVAYYLSGVDTAQNLYKVLANAYQEDIKLQARDLATKMQNDEKYYSAIGGLNQKFIDFMSKNYGVDLSNEKTLASAKLKIENDLIGTLKTNWQKYYNAQGAGLEELVARARALVLNTSRGRETYKGEHDDAVRQYNEIYAVYQQYKNVYDELDKLTLNGFSSTGFNASLTTSFDDKSKSGKTEAEKYFERLKYQLETNQITQEQYLRELDSAYKRFYNKSADYLEDYAKYSQEVYDGFKDMYKDDLDAQKDAWEKKKDAVSDYYDNLRKQIEDANDQEDYEKEQSEKRKELFDIEMKIAELMRDGSERAKARIAELEEDRKKAEEELLDFEKDSAREQELKRLEKEQEAEEKKIQEQIDGIDEQLEQLDEDTVSVRNAIIDFARKMGVTLDFAYASGTRNSVGGYGRINENGIETIFSPNGKGNYINLAQDSYVFSAKATEFLWKLATEHSLPQAMYNSIAKSIKTQSNNAPSVNVAQPIQITMGDVIIQGNADKQTVSDIKKQQENTVRMVLQKIKELQK